MAGDGDDGLWILGDYGVLLHAADGRVDHARPVAEPGGKHVTAGADGRAVISFSRSAVVTGTDPDDDRTVEPPLPEDTYVSAAAATDDGTVLVGYTNGALDAFGPDGRVRHLVDEAPGRVGALAALPDGRVAFVATNPDGEYLRVVRPDGGIRTVYEDVDRRRSINQIAPAPGNRVVALNAGSDTVPRISVIDLAGGVSETVATLSDVALCDSTDSCGPSVLQGVWSPVSVAVVGDDLVFLADGKLWRREDLFS